MRRLLGALLLPLLPSPDHQAPPHFQQPALTTELAQTSPSPSHPHPSQQRDTAPQLHLQQGSTTQPSSRLLPLYLIQTPPQPLPTATAPQLPPLQNPRPPQVPQTKPTSAS